MKTTLLPPRIQKLAATGFVVAALAIGAYGTEVPEESASSSFLQPLEKALAEGSASVKTGISAFFENQDSAQNKGFIFGFVQGDYQTRTYDGFSIGGGFVFAPEIWEENSGDYDSKFSSPAKVRRLFLRYDATDWKNTYLVGGRIGLADSPITHGDAGDGVTASLQGPLPVTLTGTAITRWTHHAKASWDGHISSTEQVKDFYPEAGDVFLNVNLEVPLGSRVTVTPSIAYQEHVLAVYATTAELVLPLEAVGKGVRWKTEVVGAFHENEAIPSVTAANDYDSHASSGRFFTALENDRASLGVGVYALSDDKLKLDPGAFSHFDPLDDDDLFPFNDENDAQLFYTKATYTLGALDLSAHFGAGRNSSAAVRSDSYEIDLQATYHFSKHLMLEAKYSTVQFENQEVRDGGDYHKARGMLRYTF
jgi:hypothetical protein